jgi:5-methylcytosine-specific restriction endonuclease McrA
MGYAMIRRADGPNPDYETPAVLQGSVLVLNRFYSPVHVVSVRRSLVMLYRALAEVIHVEDGQYFNYSFENWLELSELLAGEADPSDGHDFIRTASARIQAPRVIRLERYDKVPRRGVRFNRRNLFARDNFQCQFCGKSFPASQLSLDHVVPRSRGGQTTWENVVCSCLRCNSRKGDRTPEEANMRLLRSPVVPRQNPLIATRLENPKYDCWRPFVGASANGN